MRNRLRKLLEQIVYEDMNWRLIRPKITTSCFTPRQIQVLIDNLAPFIEQEVRDAQEFALRQHDRTM